jgi:hypothetical protein
MIPVGRSTARDGEKTMTTSRIAGALALATTALAAMSGGVAARHLVIPPVLLGTVHPGDAVELNPQPLPPRWNSYGSAVMINPQPLPPGARSQ